MKIKTRVPERKENNSTRRYGTKKAIRKKTTLNGNRAK